MTDIRTFVVVVVVVVLIRHNVNRILGRTRCAVLPREGATTIFNKIIQ